MTVKDLERPGDVTPGTAMAVPLARRVEFVLDVKNGELGFVGICRKYELRERTAHNWVKWAKDVLAKEGAAA